MFQKRQEFKPQPQGTCLWKPGIFWVNKLFAIVAESSGPHASPHSHFLTDDVGRSFRRYFARSTESVSLGGVKAACCLSWFFSTVMCGDDGQLERTWGHLRNRSLGVSMRGFLDKVNWRRQTQSQIWMIQFMDWALRLNKKEKASRAPKFSVSTSWVWTQRDPLPHTPPSWLFCHLDSSTTIAVPSKRESK